MLTPIKKQGDEHIYILLQIGIIDWVSVRYVDILRFFRMLIGSEITYRDALSILYEVRVIGNHADRDKILLKKSCHVITPAVAKARSAQVLRNSPLAIPLSGHCPKGATRHHQMPGRSWRAGKPCGDGKPVGPDRPLENGISGINKSSSDDRPGPGICDSKYVEDAKAARSVRVWDRVPMKDIGREAVLLTTMNLLL